LWAACTFKSVTNLQKTASKSLLEMLQKTPNNVTEISVFYTEISSKEIRNIK
jgi:hypothetical protein